LIGGHYNAVALFEYFTRTGNTHVKSAFDNIGRQFVDAAALADRKGSASRDFDDLRQKISLRCGYVQKRRP
jgi:hypothetical protein